MGSFPHTPPSLLSFGLLRMTYIRTKSNLGGVRVPGMKGSSRRHKRIDVSEKGKGLRKEGKKGRDK